VTTFSDFQLNPALVKSLGEEGYTDPTPIQIQAIPSVLAGKDLLGIAQTGTGKTAAFALPILHRLAANKRDPMRRGCRVLVLSPTRELASQIAESFRTYGRYLGIRVAVIFGGVGHAPQRNTMERGVDVLVATPGRLLDHIGERNVVLDGVETFVLDEADQMLDMGFIVPIRRIVAKLSARRQSLFFSATMPKEIGHLAGELLRDPVKVSVTPAATTVERVNQHVYLVETRAKRSLLVELFANPELTRTLVFTRTKRGADKVAQHLSASGISVAAIHGNKSQNQRNAALDAFKASKVRALVATDVAARGIDIDLVTHVINYELPNVPESYVHRIGRTARAGAEGIAISFCDAEERDYLRDIERLTRQSIASTDRRRDTSLALAAEPAPKANGQRHARNRPGTERGKAATGKPPHHGRSGAGATKPHRGGRDNDRTDRRGPAPAHALARRDDRRQPAGGDTGIGHVAFLASPARGASSAERGGNAQHRQGGQNHRGQGRPQRPHEHGKASEPDRRQQGWQPHRGR
jgi:ATP-dependent RNA helicase RhlE